MVDRAWIEGDRVGASLLEVLNKKRLKRIYNSNSLFMFQKELGDPSTPL